MKKVFISHPFSKNMLINKMNVEKICQEINGVIPISPLHLFSFMKDDKLRNEILKVCFQLIDLCDEVWVYGKFFVFTILPFACLNMLSLFRKWSPRCCC